MSRTPVPVAKKTVVRIQYKPHLLFYDLMYGAGNALKEFFAHWETDRLKITLKDFTRRSSLLIGHQHIIFEQDNSDEIQEREMLEAIMPLLLDRLKIDQILQFYYRRLYIVPVQVNNYSELNEILKIKLLNQDRSLLNVLPGSTTDFMYRANQSDEQYMYTLTVAPVWKEQMTQLLSFNKANHLEPSRAEQDFADVLKTYPQWGVFLSTEIFQQAVDPTVENKNPTIRFSDLQITDTMRFLEEARERSKEIAQAITNYLFESWIGE